MHNHSNNNGSALNNNKIEINKKDKQNFNNNYNNNYDGNKNNNNLINNEIILDNNLKQKNTFERLKYIQSLIHRHSFKMELCM